MHCYVIYDIVAITVVTLTRLEAMEQHYDDWIRDEIVELAADVGVKPSLKFLMFLPQEL